MSRTVSTNTYVVTIPPQAQLSRHLDKLDVWVPASGTDEYFLKLNIDTVVMDIAGIDEESIVGERLAGTVGILDLQFDDGILVSSRTGMRLHSLSRERDDGRREPEKIELREYRINGWIEEGSFFAEEARFVRTLVFCSAPDHFHTITAYFASDDPVYFSMFEEIAQSFAYRGDVGWLVEDERTLDIELQQELDAAHQDLMEEEALGEDMLIADSPGTLTVSDLRKPRYHDEGYFEFRYGVPLVSQDLKCLLYEFGEPGRRRSDEETHEMRQKFVESLNLMASIEPGKVLPELKQLMLDHYHHICELVDVAPDGATESVDPRNPLRVNSPDDAWALCEIEEAYLSMDETEHWGSHLFASLHLFPQWDSGHGTIIVFRDGEIAGVVESAASYRDFLAPA